MNGSGLPHQAFHLAVGAAEVGRDAPGDDFLRPMLLHDIVKVGVGNNPIGNNFRRVGGIADRQARISRAFVFLEKVQFVGGEDGF